MKKQTKYTYRKIKVNIENKDFSEESLSKIKANWFSTDYGRLIEDKSTGLILMDLPYSLEKKVIRVKQKPLPYWNTASNQNKNGGINI